MEVFKLYATHMVRPDTIDAEIATRRLQAWNAIKEPRLGDYLIVDGKYHRMSHIWETTIQHSESWSFYIGENGCISFSGGLNTGIKKEKIVPTDEMKDGDFWFFHNDWMKKDNGVGITAKCRVYRAIE